MGGIFLLSNYNFQKEVSTEQFKKLESGKYTGELLLDEDKLSIEYFKDVVERVEYGVSITGYMAFTRFNYDSCRTAKRLEESTGPGRYILNKPGWAHR